MTKEAFSVAKAFDEDISILLVMIIGMLIVSSIAIAAMVWAVRDHRRRFMRQSVGKKLGSQK